MHSTRALIFRGKIFACLKADWQVIGSVSGFFCVFFSWRGHWYVVWSLNWLSFLNYTHKTHTQTNKQTKIEHCFFIILRQMRVFVIREDSSIFIKKVFKILPLRQIATWRRNFETRAMLDCRCYGQHSRVKNRNKTRIIYTSCFRLG